jgi:hypothetical protein
MKFSCLKSLFEKYRFFPSNKTSTILGFVKILVQISDVNGKSKFKNGLLSSETFFQLKKSVLKRKTTNKIEANLTFCFFTVVSRV